MAGLVAYASSDEEDDEVRPQIRQPQNREATQRPEGASPPGTGTGPAPVPSSASSSAPPHTTAEPVASQPPPAVAPVAERPAPSLPSPSAPAMGPSLPPVGALAYPADAPDAPRDAQGAAGGPNTTASSSQPPLSPYSADRALVRELTLPAVPDFDIPPSPPGSPPPGAAALDAKVQTFLELKRTKGTHFNARIAQSAALRNPALMDKLLGFVGVETSWEATGRGGGAGEEGPGRRRAGGAAQYATTLPPDLWDPEGFPAWAYKGPLRKAQEKVQRERARAPGEPIEFVSTAGGGGGGGGGAGGSRTGTPGAVTGKRKSRFDT